MMYPPHTRTVKAYIQLNEQETLGLANRWEIVMRKKIERYLNEALTPT